MYAACVTMVFALTLLPYASVRFLPRWLDVDLINLGAAFLWIAFSSELFTSLEGRDGGDGDQPDLADLRRVAERLVQLGSKDEST